MQHNEAHASPPGIGIELCFGASWKTAGDLYLGRFVAIPRIGETIEIPHHASACYEVVGIRHRTATPAGDSASIRMLVRPAVVEEIESDGNQHRR